MFGNGWSEAWRVWPGMQFVFMIVYAGEGRAEYT
jgi:hypothetical protein